MKKNIAVLSIICLIVFTVSVYPNESHNSDNRVMNDVSRLTSKKVFKIIKTDGMEGIQQAIREAAARKLKISIAGSRHSQGGHIFYDDAVVVDMRDFNQIISLDVKRK